MKPHGLKRILYSGRVILMAASIIFGAGAADDLFLEEAHDIPAVIRTARGIPTQDDSREHRDSGTAGKGLVSVLAYLAYKYAGQQHGQKRTVSFSRVVSTKSLPRTMEDIDRLPKALDAHRDDLIRLLKHALPERIGEVIDLCHISVSRLDADHIEVVVSIAITEFDELDSLISLVLKELGDKMQDLYTEKITRVGREIGNTGNVETAVASVVEKQLAEVGLKKGTSRI